MQKIINDRPLFYCFLAFGFGILFARPIFSLQTLPCIFAMVCLGVIVWLCLKYKKFLSLTLIAISLLIGLLSFYISEKSFECKTYKNEQIISGRICATSISDNNQNIILDNVYINGTKTDKCVYLFIYNCTEMEEGVIVSFNGELKNTSLFTLKTFNSYYYKNNIGYTTSVNLDDLTVVSQNNLSLNEQLKLSIKYHLFKNMNEDEASICYASLFGDKTLISSETKENFSVSGMAHMLAVSGLHIGFLVTFLTFLLSLLKIKKYYKFAIILTLLGFYCYLCSFSASVVRASIMFLVLNLSNIFGKKYDRLNAWGMAGIICLFIRPLSVYDGGFLLSFGCVLCILMFAKPLEQKLIEWKVPAKLASTLGVLISVQFALIPLMSVFFTKISILALIVNFICVPLFEVFFIALLLLLPIVLIIPFFGFLLFIPKVLIGLVVDASSTVASLKFAILTLSKSTSLAIIGIYVSFFLFSHYINLKPKFKGLSVWCVCLFSAICAILGTYQFLPANQKITVLNAYNTTYVLEINNKTLAIGEFDSASINLTENYLNSSRLYVADYYVALNGSVPANNVTCFKNIYCCNPFSQYALTDKTQLKNNIHLTPIYVGEIFTGLMVENNDETYLFLNEINLSDLQIVEFALIYPNITLVAGGTDVVNKITTYINCKYVLKDGKTMYNVNNNNTTTMSGNWTINIKQDNILNVRGAD